MKYIAYIYRVISRNSKVGGYRKMLGSVNLREALIYTPQLITKFTDMGGEGGAFPKRRRGFPELV